MFDSVRPFLRGCVLAAMLALTGCGGSDDHPAASQASGELQQVYELYMMAAKSGHPLQKPADFHAKEYEGIYPSVAQGIASGRFVVLWGTPVGTSAVLAYEKDAAEKGGPVVLADGTVKDLSAAQVQEAAKAKG